MPKPEPPKLYTKKTLAMAILAVLAGASISVVREYLKTGAVSGLTIGAFIGAVLIGLMIIFLIARHANKPEGS